MDKEEKLDKVIKQVCIEYYLNNNTQQQIADKMYVSRSTVSRALTLAKERNYISTTLNFEVEKQYQFKKNIEQIYNINRLEAIDIKEFDDDFNHCFYKRAAKVIDEHVNEGTSIACSWGSFINDVVEYLPKRNVSNLKVIQLFGEITNDPKSHDQSGVIKNFAQNYNANFYQLSAPLHVANKKVKDSLITLRIIKDTLKKLDKADIILTGIGAFENYGKHSIWDQFQNEAKFKDAIDKGGIGYFCSYIIDSNGKILDCEYNDCNIAISREKIKGKKVIALVSEMYKYQAIKALLRNEMIDCLITTVEIAERLNEDIESID